MDSRKKSLGTFNIPFEEAAFRLGRAVGGSL